MLSIILTKVWPKLEHAYWKGQDGPRKNITRAFHLTVSFSSIFRSADLWSPILERSDGFAPKCYSTLLRQPAQKQLPQIIGSQIITIIFLVGLSKGSWNKCDLRYRDVCSGKVICNGVICNFLRAQTNLLYRVSCNVSAGKSKPYWYFNPTTPRMGEIRS